MHLSEHTALHLTRRYIIWVVFPDHHINQIVAEEVRFELTELLHSTVFKTVAIGHSATLPYTSNYTGCSDTYNTFLMQTGDLYESSVFRQGSGVLRECRGYRSLRRHALSEGVKAA